MNAITELAKHAGLAIAKNSPQILTAVSSAGVIGTTVLAVRATPTAVRKIDKLVNDLETEPTKIDIIKETWKLYIPAGVMGTATIVCIIGATSISTRRSAALLSLYTITEKALSEYQEKVVEVIGEKKEASIREDIAQDRLDANPVTNANVLVTKLGDTLCYDHLSGRYFKSDLEAIRKAENDLNKMLLNDSWVPLNSFYTLLGLDPIGIGDDMGWNPDNLVSIMYSAKLASDGTPCIVIEHRAEPRLDRW